LEKTQEERLNMFYKFVEVSNQEEFEWNMYCDRKEK
jgi:hypothetical protein